MRKIRWAQRVCPWWMGYFLANPLRRLMENPQKLLGNHVKPGMRVLEPGCAMGFFSLDLARMVGSEGKVIALDLQERMLAGLKKRALKAGLLGRLDIRQVDRHSLNIEDLRSSMDLAVAIHLVHELPDQAVFFKEVCDSLKPGGRLLFIEPRMHVKDGDMAASLELAEAAGFELISRREYGFGRQAILQTPAAG